MPTFQMRFPTMNEYDKLRRLTDERDDLMHWQNMFSFITYNTRRRDIFVTRGFTGANYGSGDAANRFYRGEYAGFRPAFTCLDPEKLPADLKLGDVIVIGTLYVNGKPIPVPQEYKANAVCCINTLITKIELRRPLEEPDYAIWGIYIGDDVFVADRAVLRGISIHEIDTALVR